ncbi:hypothetical protein [Rhodococcus sp. HNM0569]|uniref:hypothetical protein n=1 Tax=Rhodococcus sp. HNM0569 TaxID=2716340 RepID=UPI00146A8E30|nr:hypothetical protein [Rhodococcus sp. HNM0569]NLU84127.1 hypothetical protein [Rhodococcus sp. HNM0569]
MKYPMRVWGYGTAAVLMIAAAAWSMLHSTTTAEFAPPVHGLPAYTSTLYDGRWIGLATVFVTVAGVCVVFAVRTARRGRAGTMSHPVHRAHTM